MLVFCTDPFQFVRKEIVISWRKCLFQLLEKLRLINWNHAVTRTFFELLYISCSKMLLVFYSWIQCLQLRMFHAHSGLVCCNINIALVIALMSCLPKKTYLTLFNLLDTQCLFQIFRLICNHVHIWYLGILAEIYLGTIECRIYRTRQKMWEIPGTSIQINKHAIQM